MRNVRRETKVIDEKRYAMPDFDDDEDDLDLTPLKKISSAYDGAQAPVKERTPDKNKRTIEEEEDDVDDDVQIEETPEPTSSSEGASVDFDDDDENENEKKTKKKKKSIYKHALIAQRDRTIDDDSDDEINKVFKEVTTVKTEDDTVSGHKKQSQQKKRKVDDKFAILKKMDMSWEGANEWKARELRENEERERYKIDSRMRDEQEQIELEELKKATAQLVRTAEQEAEEIKQMGIDEAPEPTARANSIPSKALRTMNESENADDDQNEDFFKSDKMFFPEGPMFKAIMTREITQEGHMKCCAEFLIAKWYRYVKRADICNDANAIFPWLLNIIKNVKSVELVNHARDAMICFIHENERDGIFRDFYGEYNHSLTNSSYEALLVVAKQDRGWKQKRKNSKNKNIITTTKKTTTIKNVRDDDDDVIVLDHDEENITKGAKASAPALEQGNNNNNNNRVFSGGDNDNEIAGTWSAEDALSALKFVGIDNSLPASEYNLKVKLPKLAKKRTNTIWPASVPFIIEERPNVSINVLGVVGAIRVLCDYNYLRDEPPLTNGSNDKFDFEGCSEIVKLIALTRLDPRSDSSGPCFDSCLKSLLRSVSCSSILDAESKRKFAMRVSQKLANVVGNDCSSPCVNNCLRWFPVFDDYTAHIRDGCALYGFRGCVKNIQKGSIKTINNKSNAAKARERSKAVDATVDIEAFKVSFECSLNSQARNLVGDALASLRDPDFNDPNDVWQFVRLWDFADCVLKGGKSSSKDSTIDQGLQKAMKWITKLKTIAPKRSEKEATRLFRSRVNNAQNWYRNEQNMKMVNENVVDERIANNEIELD